MGRRWLCVEGFFVDFSFKCSIVVVYAPNDRSVRRTLWEEICNLKKEVQDRILAIGDFNEVLNLIERKGCVGC